ncbi:MAG: exodeoxyribonuclease I, partial [Pseudomonadales bacterium]
SGNSRWDVIDFFRMAHALRPEGFEWPKNEEDVPTFKLEELSRANGIRHESAHDAVSDVLATIDITRALKQAQPRLFQYLYNLRQKKEVIAQLYPLGKAAVVHVSSMYLAKNSCLAVVLPLCSHPTNTNGVICYDLSYDPQDLINMGPSELHGRIFTAQRDLEAGVERIHLKTIHVNRCPAVAPLPTLEPEMASRIGIDLARCEENMARLKGASGIVEKITEAFSQAEFPRTDDPDLMLYQGGFFSDRDRAQMLELRALDPGALAKATGAFDDERIEEMLFRYRARNHPESLSADEQAVWDRYRFDQWRQGGDVETTLARIDELIDAGENPDVLGDLRQYIEGIWASVRQSKKGSLT